MEIVQKRRRGVNEILAGGPPAGRIGAAQGEAAEEDRRGEKIFLGLGEMD